MNHHSLMSKIPPEWRGLFNSSFTELNGMLEWYREETSSKFGNVLIWNDLLANLVMEDPKVDKGTGSLSFETRFSQLPTCLQRTFLSFLLHHRDTIPISSLRPFVERIGPAVNPDSWVGILQRMLAAFIISSLTKEEKVSISDVYEFSSENRINLESLKGKLQNSRSAQGPWSISTKFDEVSGPVFKGDNLEEKMEEDQVMSPDLIIMDDDQPPSKVARLDPDVFPLTQFDQSQYMSMEESIVDIDPDDLEKMKILVDKWENGDETEVPPEMDVILTSPAAVVKALCEETNVTKLSETGVSSACKHLLQKENLLSHSNCTVVLSALFQDKITHLTQSASRVVSGVITMVAGTFSKPLIDGVFVPCTQNKDFGTHQADLIVKICKEVFQMTDKKYFLEGMMRTLEELSDGLILVLHNIFESKLEIENPLLSSSLELLNSQSCKMEKNLKYGKLVVAIITKYGSQMTAEHKQLLTQILMTHKSFLKKTMQAAIAKL